MERAGIAFGKALEQNGELEQAGKEMMDASLDLAKEIAAKPEQTEAEMRFINAQANFHILALLHRLKRDADK